MSLNKLCLALHSALFSHVYEVYSVKTEFIRSKPKTLNLFGLLSLLFQTNFNPSGLDNKKMTVRY